MSDEEKVQLQLLEIGNRYLRRTLGELPQLHELLQRARSGQSDSLAELGQIVHKIHGSGAMFGFEMVSGQARQLELLIADGAGAVDFWQRLESGLTLLGEGVRAAARSRGIE